MAKENKGNTPNTENEAQKVYNINAMRPAFIKMRDNGNKGVITKKVCGDLGISTSYFEWYKESVKKLFEAVRDYCRLKNSPNAEAGDVDAAYNAIFPIWKDMLSTAEADKFTRELHVTEHDISNLVSFCQTFVNDQNDVSRGEADDFVAHKVWAVQDLKPFQKRVETDLGIRIAQVEVLTDAERDFLSAERKILSKWKKAERRIKDLKASIDNLNALMAKAKGDEVKELLTGQIKDINAAIAEQQKKIDKCKKDHDALLNPPTDDVSESTEAPAPEQNEAESEQSEQPKDEQKKPRRARKPKQSSNPERPTEDAVLTGTRDTAAA